MSRENGHALTRDVGVLRIAFDGGECLTKTEGLAIYGIPDRRFRAAVSSLRHEGYPVIAQSDGGSTYRKARTEAELDIFIRSEIDSRAMDLLAQSKALRTKARDWFPPEQLRLVG